jgi:tetratricopeptide (TPR) repeat protein
MSGKLGEGVLPGVLRDVYAGRRSGFLGFARDDESCGLHFVAGDIIRGEAGPTELKLGELLVAAGFLDRPALERALETQGRTGQRLGRILQEQGAVDAEEVAHALALQARVLLARILGWKGGAYVFQEVPDPGARDRPLTTTTGEIILEAVRLVRDRDSVRHALGDLDRTVLPAADPLLRFQRVHLNPTDGFVLSRVDGTCTAEEVIQLTPLPEAESMRSLLGLLSVGMVEMVGVVPRARLPEPDPHQALRDEIVAAFSSRHTRTDAEVLGVSPGATPAEVRAAYFRLAKRFHPDAHHHPRLNDLHDEIQAVFFRINAAFDALTRAKAPAAPRQAASEPPRAVASPVPPPPAPDPPVESRPAATAAELYGKAETDYGEGRYWEAVALLEQAVPMATGLLKSRSRLLLARICVKYPDRLKQAEKELQAVVQEDPEQVEAYVLLGSLYKQQGLAARAAGHFRKALQLNPRHRTAQAELLELAPAAPDDDPSVLKRLFRR